MQNFKLGLAVVALFLHSADLSAEEKPFSFIELERWSDVETPGYARWEKVEVTYSYVTNPTAFQGSFNRQNCDRMLPVADLFRKRPDIDSRAFYAQIARAFERWSAVIPLRFRYTPHNANADILIGVVEKPRGFSWVNVWIDLRFDRTDQGTFKPIQQSAICINPEKDWQTVPSAERDRPNVESSFVHEVGHAIGLDHADDGTRMSKEYTGETELTESDIQGAQALYGGTIALLRRTGSVGR